MHYKKDILLIGKLAGVAKMFALKLIDSDFSFTLLDLGKGYSTELTEDFEKELSDFTIYSKDLSYLKLCKLINSHKLVLSFGASYGRLFYKYFYLHKILKKPIIEMHTGADIKELSIDNSILGYFYRYYIKSVSINFTAPEMIAVRNIIKLKLSNTVIYRLFPYLDVKKRNILLDKKIQFGEKVKIFSASHLDWMENDYFDGRNSIKANDKFFVAIKNLVDSGFDNFEVTLLNRGPDKDIAIKYIKENNLEKFFIIKEHMDRDTLFNEMINAHLLVNEFGAGAIGGVAMEALSLGLPVMSRIGEIGQVFYYGNDCPVINCFSIDEIYKNLVDILENTEKLNIISNSSYEWFHKNISDDKILYPIKLYYSILTGEDKFGLDCFELELEERKIKGGFLNR